MIMSLKILFLIFLNTPRLTRKVILVSSMMGMSACYLVLGGCFFIIEDNLRRTKAGEEVEEFQWGWVPPTAILILLFLGNGGYGTLIWVVVAEVLPPKVRALGNICICFILGFIASKTFVDLV